MNGGVCINGACKCRKGFMGNYCQMVEYVPDKTNYTEYLRIFLFYIIMVLIIIGLLAGGYLLFKHAEDIKNRLENMLPKRADPIPVVDEDPDDLAGGGIRSGTSRYGNNAMINK